MALIKRRKIAKKKAVKFTAEYNRIAEIKSIIKSLDNECKNIQAKVLAHSKLKKIKTPFGILFLRTRENYECKDKDMVINYMGQKDYNENSSISKAGIIKAIGEQGFTDIWDKGGMVITSVSKYYQLTPFKPGEIK